MVVETRTAPVTTCRACGNNLEGVSPSGHERRVQVDIVFETRELTVEAEVKTCPRCRTETRGRFPEDMPGPLQYGHGIVAFATHLLAEPVLHADETGLRAMKTSTRPSSSTKPKCSASPATPWSRSPTTAPSAISASPRSNRKSPGASAPPGTPPPTAASPATCSPWRSKATIPSPPSTSHSTVTPPI